jgi:hypothetical protein
MREFVPGASVAGLTLTGVAIIGYVDYEAGGRGAGCVCGGNDQFGVPVEGSAGPGDCLPHIQYQFPTRSHIVTNSDCYQLVLHLRVTWGPSQALQNPLHALSRSRGQKWNPRSPP